MLIDPGSLSSTVDAINAADFERQLDEKSDSSAASLRSTPCATATRILECG